ncbi:Fic family protein [Patescibacteria group bacterium]
MYVPKYSITNLVLKNIGAIEAAKEMVDSAPLVPFYEKQFKTEALARQVHHGTHIEGNDLSLSQTKKVLEGEDIFGKDRDIQEVINYRNVMNLLDELVNREGPYQVQDLLNIHRSTVEKIVPEEKIGVRKTQVLIKEEGTGKVILSPPPFVEVQFLLNDFFKWLNSPETREIHPVIKAGIVHYVLVAIHPFVEGNGRAIRAFATLVMYREGYNVKRFFALEEHFDQDLADYYEALAKVDKISPNIIERDLTSWLEYFTQVVAVELEKIKEKVKKISVDSHLKGRLGKQVALTERQMKLVEYLSENNSGIMRDLTQILSMVSEDTVLRDLKDMMEKGIIRKEGSTKASRYYLIGK